jgi:hypothetical protein
MSLAIATDEHWWDLARAVLDREVCLPSGLSISQRAVLAGMVCDLIQSRREGRRGGAVVYFIRDCANGLIKIGCSSNEWKRLRALQTAQTVRCEPCQRRVVSPERRTCRAH